MIKIGLESWDALGSCNIASPAESMNPRSLPDQEKQSDPERPRTPRANYAHDLRTYHILILKTTSTQSISSVSLRHKLTQSKTFTNTKRHTHVLGWNPPLFFLKKFKVNQCWPRENQILWENPQKITNNFCRSRFQLLWAQNFLKHQGTIHPSASINSFTRLHTWQTQLNGQIIGWHKNIIAILYWEIYYHVNEGSSLD